MFGIGFSYSYADQEKQINIKGNGPMMGQGGLNGQANFKPMTMGTITSIDSNIITIESIKFNRPESKNDKTTTTKETITYKVDASNASFTEEGETASISDVSVGDRISIEGTINDTSIVATKIHIGNNMKNGDEIKNNAIKEGTGEPVVDNGNTNTSQNNSRSGVFRRMFGFFSNLFGF